MTGRVHMPTIAVVLIVIALVIAGFAVYNVGRHNPSAKAIQRIIEAREQAIKEEQARELSRLNGEITALRDDLAQSRDRYARVRALVRQKAQEAAEVKAPQSTEEIRERFNSLGYPAL